MITLVPDGGFHSSTMVSFVWKESLCVKVHITEVLKRSISGLSSPHLSPHLLSSACRYMLVSVSSCSLGFRVSGFQTATFGCSSTEMEPLRSAASGSETGERPDLNFVTFCVTSSFCFFPTFSCYLCVALCSYFLCLIHFMHSFCYRNLSLLNCVKQNSTTDQNVPKHLFQQNQVLNPSNPIRVHFSKSLQHWISAPYDLVWHHIINNKYI